MPLPTPETNIGPKAPETLPHSQLNPTQVESAWQKMRDIISGASAKNLKSPDDIKTKADDGTELKLDQAAKTDLVKTLNLDNGETVKASGNIEPCEEVYEATGQKFYGEEEARKNGGLVLEPDDSFKGRYFKKDAAGTITEGRVDPNSVTLAIRGLRRATHEGNADAKEAYDSLRDNDAIRVTYTSTADGQPQEVTTTLKDFDAQLEKEAANLWTAEHGGDLSYADAVQKFPQIAQAYRIKAEQKFASDAKYTLHSTAEAPTQSAGEAPKTPEAEALEKQTVDLAVKVLDATVTNFSEVKKKGWKAVEEAVKNTDPEGCLGRLMRLVADYDDPKTSPDARLTQAAQIYYELQTINQSKSPLPLNADLKAEIGGLPQKTGIKIFESQLLECKRVALRQAGYPEQYINEQLQNPAIPMENILRDTTLAYTLKFENLTRDPDGKWRLPQDVQALLSKWTAQGHCTEDEKNFIIRLVSEGNAELVLTKTFGLNVKELQDKNATAIYSKKVVESIDKRREDGKKLSGAEKNDAVAMLKRLLELHIEKAKKDRRFPGWLKGAGMIGLLLMQLVGQLNFGVDKPGQGQQG